MPMVISATLSCWALVWAISGEATQRLTVPEALTAAGKSLVAGSTVPSGPAPSLTEILAETDLMVRGSVGAGRSYLSDDQTNVLTEWVIDNPVVIYQRDPAMPSTHDVAEREQSAALSRLRECGEDSATTCSPPSRLRRCGAAAFTRLAEP
jgi:hypothetical protein